MTEVKFHFNAPEPLHYACRLLRKALRSGARIAVTGSSHRLAELDRMLWTFEPLEFVPHWRGPKLADLPARLAPTPVILVGELSGAASEYAVLVNLGDDVPVGVDDFDRVVEIVAREDEARVSARARWKHYAGKGMKVEGHEVVT